MQRDQQLPWRPHIPNATWLQFECFLDISSHAWRQRQRKLEEEEKEDEEREEEKEEGEEEGENGGKLA